MSKSHPNGIPAQPSVREVEVLRSISARLHSRMLLLWLVVAVVALGPVRVDAATLAERWSLERAVTQSELIILGSVRRIEFRDSDKGGEDALVAPHTFVTYRIEQIVRGTYADHEITLRFMGGYSQITGRIMLMPGSPLFAADDRDLLLVRANGAHHCPLAGCGLGRFRIVDEKVYDDTGLAVRLTSRGDFQLGPDALEEGRIAMVAPAAPEARLVELRERIASDSSLDYAEREQLRERLRAMSAPRTIGIRRSHHARDEQTEPPISLERFLALLQVLAERAPDATGTVVSVTVDEPFRVSVPTPQRVVPSSRTSDPRPPTLEQQLLRRNHGNPVLGDAAEVGR